MKEKVLKFLKEANGYVSGQTLCSELNVSRTAVWKYINQLKEEGYDIDAVTRRGYLLKNEPDLVTKEAVGSNLTTKFWGRDIVYFQNTDSTNIQAKKLAEEGCSHGTLVISDFQTAGRGRRGKSWNSPKGSGIWMSFVLRPAIKPQNAAMLTIVAAMAAKDAIATVPGVEPLIKWPNDIVISGKKVCGILTEMSAEMDWINYVVIGVGINANIPSFPEDISKIATSLEIESGNVVSRSGIIAKFGSSFEKYYEKFIAQGNLQLLVDDYNKSLANINNKVKILEPGNEYVGIALGINNEGELVVEKESKEICIVRSGEVSVRGIYGYV